MKKLTFLLLTGFIITNLSAQMTIPNAQAMFIYNFSKLVEWPANYKTGPFVIGVLGNATIISELETFTSGKMVGAQNIVVEMYKEVADIGKCNMLFVTYGKTKFLSEVKSTLANKSTLIITERNGALDEGAAINFLVIGDRLKFEFSPSNTTKAGVKYSTKLTEMAYK